MTVSPLSQYQVGISDIQYWITQSGASGFVSGPSGQTACQGNKNRSDQLQRLTVTGSAPGANDQLAFVVADPNFLTPPTTLTINDPVGTPPGNFNTGDDLTFTATLSPTGAPAPTGTITWNIDAPAGAPVCATTTLPAPGGISCTVHDAQPGDYTLTASYSGDAKYLPTSATSPPLHVYAPSQLAFTTEPGGGPNGEAWTTQPVVNVENILGYTAMSNSDTVTLAIASPLGNGATLTCTGGPLRGRHRRRS